MKFLNHLLIGALAFGLWSCSSEDPDANGTNEATKGDVFATLTLNLPTRSGTVDTTDPTQTNSSDGYEIGSDAENHVSQVLVVLATQNGNDYDYVTCSLSDARINNLATDPTYVIQFQTTKLNELVKEGPATVSVFAYCNPNQQFKDLFLDSEEQPLDAVANFTDEILTIAREDQIMMTTNIYQDNYFLMSNADLHTATVPALETLISTHNTQAKAFNLGTVDVKRASARFDFASTDNGYGANIYPIKDQITEEVVANVEIDALALFNEAKSFYALPRVSANGLNQDISLCGIETRANWVVSPFATEKMANPIDFETFKSHYLYPLGQNAMQYNFMTVGEIENAANEDDDNNWTDGNKAKLNYYKWRYSTENTIPDIEAQQKGITTGVIFRAKMTPIANAAEGSQAAKLATAMNNGDILYAYKGVLYGNAEDLMKASKEVPGSVFESSIASAFGDNTNVNAQGNLIKSVNDITIYRPSKDAEGKIVYYCYYYYYNRHNNNGNNNMMGAMEFDVVRNNVYKLSVDNVYEYGHPGNPDDDPDPEEDPDPDETPKAYFKVSCRVIPWVVRVNHIEF
ncbi:MAG: Mfa1 family fimbria major subunit [Muribaculum sp.]|nr:Mfa1 family fimbria major subunit [Muribaculum sp.]